MKWLRHDSEIDDHPDVIFAGFYGARIAEALCRTSKKFDLGGVVPSKYATPLYLSRQLGLDIDLCRKGLDDASRINPDAEEGEPPLIVRDVSGNVMIPGWDKINGDREIENIREKARARKERYKERHKNAEEHSRNVPGTFQNVTERDGTKGTGDGTGRDTTGQGIISTPTGSHPANGVAGAHVPEVKVPTKHLIAEWNRIAAPAGAVHCRAFAPASEANMRARWIEAGKDDGERLATFLAQYTAIAASPLCTGRVESKNGGRSWRAGLDWLVRPTNWAKVANGNYAAGPARESSAVRLARRMGVYDEETGGLLP